MKLSTLSLVVASIATVVTVAPAFAVVTNQTNVDVHSVINPALPEFIAGSGIQIDNFVQDSVSPAGQSLSVAIKGRNREDFSTDIITGGNRYGVKPGQSLVNTARPNFTFDYQFDAGLDATTNYILQLDVDFDPTPGVANFSTLRLPIFGGAGALDGWNDTDGFFTTRKRPWNDESVPYVVSNSGNLGFFPVPAGAPAYNSSTLGEYELRLTAFDPTGLVQLAGVTAFVVVPEPTTLAALAGAGVIGLRRRRA